MAGEKARLFVALDLPDPVRSAVSAWQEEALTGIPELRAVSPEALHVTLCFLGWRTVDEIEPVGALASGAASAAPDLALGGAVWLPRRRPRVLALEVLDRGGTCARLQAAVSDALVERAFFEPEKRPFFPHITVGRVRGQPARTLHRHEPAPAPPALRFAGAAVTLYRSRPTRSGATYEPLARTTLR